MAVRQMREQDCPVQFACAVYCLNRSFYYQWTHRKKSARERQNEEVTTVVKVIYWQYKVIYGYRRLADEYNQTHGTHYNLKRFYRIAQTEKLKAVIRKKRPAYQRSMPEITTENILNRDFLQTEPNSVWLTDVTEIKYGEGQKLYLSAILDLGTREVVSFVMSRRNDNRLVFDTFDLAVRKHPDAKPLFHSDRGFQYTSKAFRSKLDQAGMSQSMSRVGRCIDNGPMEGFWGILKSEMYYLNHFEDYASLEKAVTDFITFYNCKRRQHRLMQLPPVEYRQRLIATQQKS